MSAPNYKFQFCIVDQSTGETVIEDYCTLGSIDDFGGSEMVDMHVASTLRKFKRGVRQEYERKNQPETVE